MMSFEAVRFAEKATAKPFLPWYAALSAGSLQKYSRSKISLMSFPSSINFTICARLFPKAFLSFMYFASPNIITSSVVWVWKSKPGLPAFFLLYNVVIPFNQPSEKEKQPGSDAPAGQGQSRGGRNGRNTRPDRIGGIFWTGHDRYPR